MCPLVNKYLISNQLMVKQSENINWNNHVMCGVKHFQAFSSFLFFTGRQMLFSMYVKRSQSNYLKEIGGGAPEMPFVLLLPKTRAPN